jgi:hypothetical protein
MLLGWLFVGHEFRLFGIQIYIHFLSLNQFKNQLGSRTEAKGSSSN